jgi:hypothetical protein
VRQASSPPAVSSSLIDFILAWIFFWKFFGPREVHGIDDYDFGFGFTEWDTAGAAAPAITCRLCNPKDDRGASNRCFNVTIATSVMKACR